MKKNTAILVCLIGIVSSLYAMEYEGSSTHEKHDVEEMSLHMALIEDPDYALELIKKHASDTAYLNEPNKSGKTPLHIACLHQRSEHIRALLLHGAVPTVADREGNTPLHYAAISGADDVIDALVNAGAVIDAQNSKGETPLYKAVGDEQVVVIEKLLQLGASPFVTDISGEDILTMIKRRVKWDFRDHKDQTHFDTIYDLCQRSVYGIQLNKIIAEEKKDQNPSYLFLLPHDLLAMIALYVAQQTNIYDV